MKQTNLPFPTPKKRGRPRLTPEQRRKRGSLVPRVARPSLSARNPLHVTLRAEKDLPSFRSKGRFKRIRKALREGADRFGMRLVQFAVLSDHIHLIVEASDKEALSRGMQGLTIRVSKANNRGERKGKVFRDRYHAVVLDNPTQVRNTLAYVLLNSRRHGSRKEWIDPCSSGYWFDGWSRDVEALCRAAKEILDFDECPTASPRTWLLGVGWRRAKLIDPFEIPGA